MGGRTLASLVGLKQLAAAGVGAVLFAAFGVSMAPAYAQGGPGGQGGGMQSMGQGRPGGGSMGGASAAQMVATTDYLYVLRGNILYQYSVRDLSQVRKATLPESAGSGQQPGRSGASRQGSQGGRPQMQGGGSGAPSEAGGGPSSGASLSATSQYAFVLRGNTLYQYSASTMTLAKKTALPDAPSNGMGQGMGGPEGMGGPGGPGGGMGGPGGGSSNYTLSGVYTLSDGSSKTEADKSIGSDMTDTSAVYVYNGSSLTLTNPTIETSGRSSSNEASSFHGLNAGVLAGVNGKVTINGGSISTTGSGANGLFAAGQGSVATMVGGKIHATGGGAHGVMATKGGTVYLTNVEIVTTNERGAPIATDRGSGTIVVKGGITWSGGKGSPAIYSTGVITVSDATMLATGAEGAVIEGSNSITLNNCNLTGEKQNGAMIYQSFSGDAEGRRGVFTMTGGSMTAKVGPLFFVTNTNAVIKLSGVKLSAASGVLVNAGVARWGRTGSNGGHASLTADHQEMAGDLAADEISSIAVSLTNGSVLTGKATHAAISIDATSKWIVTGDSALTSLTVAGGASGSSIGSIVGNGHAVTYDASLNANAWLGGKTYTLAGGGTLSPK